MELPRDSLIVMTGLFRLRQKLLGLRYHLRRGAAALWSRSPYARQFLGRWRSRTWIPSTAFRPPFHRPEDHRKTRARPWARSRRSTITCACSTRAPACRIRPVCGKEIRQQTVDQIVDQVLMLPERTRIQVMAPVVRSRKGEYAKPLRTWASRAFVRMRVDGEIYEISDPPKLAKTKKHTLEVVVDRLTVRADIQQRPHGFAGNGP